jgi:hypothetical protein
VYGGKTRKVRDKRVIVDLFRRCGKDELTFLVNSGASVGAVLGLGQVVVNDVSPDASIPPSTTLTSSATRFVRCGFDASSSD